MSVESAAAADLFARTFGSAPQHGASAPGRVNLIGEHVDYSGGLVLPFAIDARAGVAVAATDRDEIRLVSRQRPGDVVVTAAGDLRPGSPAAHSWAGYPLGAIWVLRALGVEIGGLDIALDSTVPSGAGLSSSAALECATVLAVAATAGITPTPRQVARWALRVENEFVGVPCGPMDQTASACARAGSVLLFDTRADTVEYAPFDPGAEGLTVLVVDTRATHALGDGQYARRRAACDEAARRLQVDQLRDLAPDSLPGVLERLGDAELDGEPLAARVRHVITENARVAQVVQALRAGRLREIGSLLTASHASLRNDYEVSCAELDVAVRAALDAGALGARMTGGGFGGSAIALVPTDRAGALRADVERAFASAGFLPPLIREVQADAGARVEDVAGG